MTLLRPIQRLRPLAVLVSVALCASAASAADTSTSPDGAEFFEKKVRPLLVEQCYQCHSATAKKGIKGGLSLDSRDATLRGGDSGPAILPGNPDGSRLIRAVRWKDDKLQMPP